MLGPRVGRLAALILATAPIMVAESKLATTDATLAFLVVGCQFCPLGAGAAAVAAGGGGLLAVLGLAVLTKAPRRRPS